MIYLKWSLWRKLQQSCQLSSFSKLQFPIWWAFYFYLICFELIYAKFEYILIWKFWKLADIFSVKCNSRFSRSLRNTSMPILPTLFLTNKVCSLERQSILRYMCRMLTTICIPRTWIFVWRLHEESSRGGFPKFRRRIDTFYWRCFASLIYIYTKIVSK